MVERLREQLGYEQQVSDQQSVFIRRRRGGGTPHTQQLASPHYAGHSAGNHPEDTPYITRNRPRRTVQPQPYDEEEDDDALYDQRPPTSAIRYPRQTAPTPNRTRVVYAPAKETVQLRSPRFHWLFWGGLALCVMMAGFLALSALGSWWQVQQDDWHYGRPRTAQYDAVVGHNGDSAANPSHFIALNLNRKVMVIELPAGDSACPRRHRAAYHYPGAGGRRGLFFHRS
jgi:hypothetical protein